MKSFRNYLSENNYFDYGVPKEPGHDRFYFGDKAKINPKDPIIQHFARTGLLRKYEEMSPPDEEHTIKEINHLLSRMANLSQEQTQFVMRADTDPPSMYHKFAQSIGLNLPTGFAQNIADQTDPILFHLKDYHNRSRPETFAKENNIPFKTAIPHDLTHAAYPSGHALDSYIMSHILRSLRPQHSDAIEEFTRKMRESRLDAGVHYPSDNEISKHLANDIISNKLIQIPKL